MLDGAATTGSTDQIVVRDGVSRARRYYVLVVLTLVGTMSILDRQIMTILVEPIRHELSLNDTQMGFLTGIAFTLIYVTLCIPAARLADRWSRTKMVALALTIWSIMTMLCGVAQNKFQLFFARFGVGFGEAGGSPSSHAFISDIFPRHQRATAMAFLMLSSSLGLGLGLFLGGRSLAAFGWRTTFILAGIPGLVLMPLVLFTFPKVQKGMADGADPTLQNESLLSTLRILWSVKAVPNMMLASTLYTVVAMGSTTWIPAFLERSHGMDHASIGAKLGAALGIGSLIGHLAGGPLSDWLGRRDLRWHFWVPMIASPIAGCLAAAAFIGPVQSVFVLLSLQILLGGLFSGPMIAIMMNLAPVSARATASACLYLVINAVGLGLGPQFVGILSDLLRPRFGNESLRIALICACATMIPAGYFFYRASRTYIANIREIDAINKHNG